MAAKFDAYQTITDKIIEAIEAGVAPWRRGWQSNVNMSLPLRSNGEKYKGDQCSDSLDCYHEKRLQK